MNNSSGGSITKLLAAIIIGVVFIFLLGTVAHGWQKNNTEDNNSDETEDSLGNVDESNGDTDGSNDGIVDNNTQMPEDEPEIPVPPAITAYLTGLEISEELADDLPFAIVTEPNAPLYGISGAELTIEIPIEDGQTRFLVYRTDVSELGKIGAISKTRNYISQFVKFYGGILVANGKDDIVNYTSIPSTLHVDLSKNSEYVYKENGRNVYIDYQNLSEIVKNEGIDTSKYSSQSIPFDFCDYFESVSGKTAAATITLPYFENHTKLTYDENSGVYLLSKGDRDKIDMLDGKIAAYKNVFVLFADMITYETAAGTETVVNSATRGTGYYVTNGKLSEIRWSVDSGGQLIFKDLNGNKLIANRGSSYIGYYKSSDSNSVTFG